MLKISSALEDMVKKQPFFMFGFRNRLFNLSKLADFLRPLLEIRTKKEVRKSAVLMNLSRFQRKIAPRTVRRDNFFTVDNLNVNYNLGAVTFYRREQTFGEISQFYLKNAKKYLTLSQGMREIIVITNEELLPRLQRTIKAKPKRVRRDLASLGVQFDPKYLETPGLLYYLIQQITTQSINIEELSSSDTELIFYLKRKDMPLAFETLSELVK